ncbi:MAG TPA: tRNA adenosine(34) deaminase TadA [Thermoanaerobaculia bacterium]|nr:tRNA adenosine(34) deaminase TadA [Thermoanaerobaculia bacterium]
MNDLDFMRAALAEARRAELEGEVPIGAVIVHDGKIVATGRNRREGRGDPLAHAELEAIRAASDATAGWRLERMTMFVTLEPCAMCAGALVASRIERLVFATPDPKAGFCGSLGNLAADPRLNHRLVVESGLLQEESAELLTGFFRRLRRGEELIEANR